MNYHEAELRKLENLNLADLKCKLLAWVQSGRFEDGDPERYELVCEINTTIEHLSSIRDVLMYKFKPESVRVQEALDATIQNLVNQGLIQNPRDTVTVMQETKGWETVNYTKIAEMEVPKEVWSPETDNNLHIAFLRDLKDSLEEIGLIPGELISSEVYEDEVIETSYWRKHEVETTGCHEPERQDTLQL